MSFYIPGLDDDSVREKSYQRDKDLMIDKLAKFMYYLDKDEIEGIRQFIKQLGKDYKKQRLEREMKELQKELNIMQTGNTQSKSNNYSNDLVWSEEDQQYITVPDGNVATHEQIRKYLGGM